jgi:uncharacterized membrane protein (DUF485 family)
VEDSDSLSFDAATLAGPALGFSVGALVAGFAALTAWSNAYMNANPATGSVSGGSPLTVAALFVVGTAIMFVAAFSGLERVVRTTE